MRVKGQKSFGVPNKHGGNRKHDWGRKQKRRGRRRAESHAKRPMVEERFPVHVTMRVRDGLENLRRPGVFAVVRRALRGGKEKEGFRLNQFSVQSNHLHLVIEADDAGKLARGMCGLATRLAKALNRCWRRRGKVFAERYHAVILRSARQVRHALRYVLNNFLRHGGRPRGRRPDYCSSGLWFEGWKDYAPHPGDGACPVVPARSALQRFVWKRYGLFSVTDRPAGAL